MCFAICEHTEGYKGEKLIRDVSEEGMMASDGIKYSILLGLSPTKDFQSQVKVKVCFIVSSVHTYRELKLHYSLTPWCIQITLNTNSRMQNTDKYKSNIYIYIYIYIYIHIHIHTYIHAYIYIHTYIHKMQLLQIYR